MAAQHEILRAPSSTGHARRACQCSIQWKQSGVPLTGSGAHIPEQSEYFTTPPSQQEHP